MKDTISNQELLSTLQRLDRFAEISDSKFRIPFTQFRFGLDGIIGLIPIVGDVVGFLASCYLLYEASRLEAPWSLRFRMFFNMLLDWIIGLVPVIGDIGDVAFKANKRNMKLLVSFIDQGYQQRLAKNDDNDDENSAISRYISLIIVALMISLSIYAMTQYSGS